MLRLSRFLSLNHDERQGFIWGFEVGPGDAVGTVGERSDLAMLFVLPVPWRMKWLGVEVWEVANFERGACLVKRHSQHCLGTNDVHSITNFVSSTRMMPQSSAGYI